MALEEYGEAATGDRFFGYVHAPDPRDKNYPMRLQLDPMRELAFPRGIPPGTRHYPPGRILNQKQTGTCVAHGVTARIEGAPIMQKMPMSPYDFYRKIVGLDEFLENDAEATAPDSGLQYGTSARAGMKAGQALGLIANYLSAESVEDVRDWHLSGKGGVVFAVPWKTGQMESDGDGFINFTGDIEGYHCVATTGWSDTVRKRGRLVRAGRIQQSWGLPWGDKGKGRAWVSEEDVAQWLQDRYSECYAATEVRVKPLVIAA